MSNEPILADGGTYESVGDYFKRVMKAGTFWPSFEENEKNFS